MKVIFDWANELASSTAVNPTILYPAGVKKALPVLEVVVTFTQITVGRQSQRQGRESVMECEGTNTV